MSTECIPRCVFLDSTLLGYKVSLHGECNCDRAISAQLSLECCNPAHTLVGTGFVLVTSLAEASLTSALLSTSWVHLSNCGTVRERRCNVMSALRHGLGVAKRVVPLIASSDNSSVLEPGPGSPDLPSIAPHGETAQESTAPSGVGC